MGTSADEEVLVELDDRRRVYLAKVGNSAHKRYLVRTEPDGTMIFTPATVVPTHVLRLIDRPDVLAAIRNAQEHPEQLVRRKLRKGPAVDWETP
jgi:Trk K+ transport system NAD-binding subunit